MNPAPLSPLEDPQWDSKVAEFPSASIFHTAAWARVLHKTYGYKPLYFTTGSSEKFESLLPLMEVHSALTGSRGIALPFTDECRPLAHATESLLEVSDRVLHYARQAGWKYVEFRGAPNSAFTQASPASQYWVHQLRLGRESEVFAGLDAAVRRGIRKAEQNQVSVRESLDFEDVREFYRLHCLTRRRHGVPPQPFSFFENIYRYIILQLGHGRLLIARRTGRVLASALFFHHDQTAFYKFGASDHTQQAYRPNNLVMWKAIQAYSAAGFTHLDFGRTSLYNEGLRRFKLSWGSSEARLVYHRYVPGSSQFVAAPDHSSGWHALAFRKLPLPLLQLIGSLLYKHIA
jgi:hypothetical protein